MKPLDYYIRFYTNQRMYLNGFFYTIKAIYYSNINNCILTLTNSSNINIDVDCKEVMPVLKRFNKGNFSEWNQEQTKQFYYDLKRIGEEENNLLRYCHTEEGVFFNSEAIVTITSLGYDMFGLIEARLAFDAKLARELYDNFLTDI